MTIAQRQLAVFTDLKGIALTLYAAHVLDEDLRQAAVFILRHGAAEAQLVADDAGEGGAKLLGLRQPHGLRIGLAGKADAHYQQRRQQQHDQHRTQHLGQGDAPPVTEFSHGVSSDT